MTGSNPGHAEVQEWSASQEGTISSRLEGRQNEQDTQTGSATQEANSMVDETLSATRTINAPAEAIFTLLADPAKHAAIDGTGWGANPSTAST